MHHHENYRNYYANARQPEHFRPTVNRSLSETSPVVLDEYNSDLNFVIEGDGCTGSTLHNSGFEYLWAGARSTYGVSEGKVCYEVEILENLPVNMPETERTPHVARVGWSTDCSNLNVGEDRYSYGYGGTGKSSSNYRFFDYGEPYSVNDVIKCYIDFDNGRIFFSKNGKFLGEAFPLSPETRGKAFYPHVTIKNMKVRVNFGQYPLREPPVQGFTMIDHVPKHTLIRGSRGPDTFRDCQVIMMVGVPGAGKTVWAKKFTEEHKELKINILGTNTIMDRMKVTGLTRNRNYHGRWDQLIKPATDILNKMFKIAEKKKRNYILDQTNVYPGARGRKMSSFHNFRRIAAVIVNTNEVLKQRTEKREREEGKIVPESAVMAMKANFTLPEIGESFDDVWYIEEDQHSSARLVEEFRQEGKLFQERERENELKRKRGEMSAGAEPPSKEPYNPQHDHNRHHDPPHYHPRDQHHDSHHPPSGHRHESHRQPYPPRDQPRHPATGYSDPSHQPYPPRDQPHHPATGNNDLSHQPYPPRDQPHHPATGNNDPYRQPYPPRDQPNYPLTGYNDMSRQHYPPVDRNAAGQGYPPRGHGNEPPRYHQGNFDAQYHPPWGHGGHNPTYGQQTYPPQYGGYYQHQAAPTYPAHRDNYYNLHPGYRDHTVPYPVLESQPRGCSSFDPIMNTTGRQPQENEDFNRGCTREPQINDDRFHRHRSNQGHNRRGGYNFS